MRVRAPDGSPPFLAAFAQQINAALDALGRALAPSPLYAIDSAADLARLPPQQNKDRLVYVRDIARLAVCDGLAWRRQDTGASL